jgi:hypothetical protein
MRRPCKFTEADLRRAIRAARKEGISGRVDVTADGRISIPPTPETAAEGVTTVEVNEWDALGQ